MDQLTEQFIQERAAATSRRKYTAVLVFLLSAAMAVVVVISLRSMTVQMNRMVDYVEKMAVNTRTMCEAIQVDDPSRHCQ